MMLFTSTAYLATGVEPKVQEPDAMLALGPESGSADDASALVVVPEGFTATTLVTSTTLPVTTTTTRPAAVENRAVIVRISPVRVVSATPEPAPVTATTTSTTPAVVTGSVSSSAPAPPPTVPTTTLPPRTSPPSSLALVADKKADGKSNGSDEGGASWFGAPAATCAHRTLPKGTVVRVIRLSTGADTTCRVADRGPYIDGRVIDLSTDTFARLAPTGAGVIDVRIEW